MSYLVLQGTKLNELLSIAKQRLKGVDFDTIAVRGNSGLLIGAPLAIALEKNILLVRKDTESNHSSSAVEGWGFGQKILILDDFAETGRTLKIIKEQIMAFCPNHTIVGTYLYAAWKTEFVPHLK